MSEKPKIVSIGIGVLAVLAGISGALQATKLQWGGKTVIVDGVETVQNPKNPLFGNVRFELSAELSLGSADDPNFNFFRIRGIDVDRAGNIYVADMSNFRVQKFDPNGKYAMTFGRSGQGPGEFEQPTELVVDDEAGIVYVYDAGRTLEEFKGDGTPIRSVLLDHVVRQMDLGPSGMLLVNFWQVSEKGSFHRLCLVSPEGKIARTYGEVPYHILMGTYKGSVVGSQSEYTTGIHFSPLAAGYFVFGDSREYLLTVINPDGKIQLRFGRDDEKRRLPASERAKFRKFSDTFGPLKFSPPEFEPFFYAVLADDVGRVYVQRNRTRGLEEDVRREMDVFGRDGHFLYRTSLPRGTYVIRNGCLYAVETGDDEIVKRFRIKNWASIKSER